MLWKGSLRIYPGKGEGSNPRYFRQVLIDFIDTSYSVISILKKEHCNLRRLQCSDHTCVKGFEPPTPSSVD